MKRRQQTPAPARATPAQAPLACLPQPPVCSADQDWLLDAQSSMGNQAALAALQAQTTPAAGPAAPRSTTYGRAPVDRNGVAQGPYGHLGGT